MTIRRATEADEAALRELWEEFGAEVPDPFDDPETWDEEWADTRDDLASGYVFLAEDEQGVAGAARAEAVRHGTAFVQLVHVRPRARRQGVARALLAAVVEAARADGAQRLALEVLKGNGAARSAWSRLGFEEVSLTLAAPLEVLDERLAGAAGDATFGSIHVQTDDHAAVAAAVEKYRPRIAPPAQTGVEGPANGWIAYYDELLERDPTLLRRFARELSNALGAVVVCFTVEEDQAVGYALFERGRSVDDYLSLPEFHGPLPPGDVVAMAANPRVVQRLTGADPAEVRAVAVNAVSSAELPPARELVAAIAATMGISGADRGYQA